MYNTTVRTVWWRNPLMCCCIKTHTVPKIIWISQSLSRLEQLFQCQIYVHKGQTYTVAYAPAVTDLVFAQRFRSFLGHCGLRFRRLSIGSEYSEVTKKTHTHSFYCTQNTDSTVCTVCTVWAVQYVCAVHIPLHDYLVRVLQRSANA